MNHFFLWAASIVTLGACFSPDYGATSFACSDEDECPSGYECRSDSLCHRNGSAIDAPDAGLFDGAQADADPNAPDADPNAPDADPNAPDAEVGIVANDVCANADLLLNGVTTVGTLTGAVSNDDYSCGNTTQAEVFYTFTLSQARKITLTLGSAFDTTMSLLNSDCASERLCVNDTIVGETGIEENLAAGTYFVAVESSSGASGNFTIELNTAAPIVRPSNDRCPGIIELLDGVTRVGDTAALALDDVTPSCGAAGTGDVVYNFTVPPGGNQRAVASVTSAVGFDAALMLTSGGCPGTEVLCAQNSDGDNETLDMGNLAPGTYTLWLDANGVTPTSFDIRLDLLPAVPPPDNDTCSAPTLLTENLVTAGSTIGATDDNDLICLAFDSVDTVHEFTVSAAGAVLVTLEPLTDWALAASLRAAASCDVSADVSCLDGAFATRYFNRPNLAAGTYDVLVDGVGGDRGDYEINYQTRPVDAGFGYWQFASTGTFTPLGAAATSLTITDFFDEEQFALALPFDFPFYGSTHNGLTVHTNGFLSFDAVASGLVAANINNDCSLNATTPFNMIAPYWDDLVAFTADNPSIKHQVQGVTPHRRFVVEWANWDIFESSPCAGQCNVLGALVTHQAILHEDGDIEFRYGPRTAPTLLTGCENQHTGCSATIGLRNSDGSDNDQVGCDTTGLVADGTGFYFVHPR